MSNQELLFKSFQDVVRSTFHEDFIALHRPVFSDSEKDMLCNCIDSNFVSSAGEEIELFEQKIAKVADRKYCVATVNGTSALHATLVALGVSVGHEVITQSLSFVATANAIALSGASPIFLDVEPKTGTLSSEFLYEFLKNETYGKAGGLYNKSSDCQIKACVVMHTFGHPAEMDKIYDLCQKFGIFCIEDAAEALGSMYKGQPAGSLSDAAVFSFNGNKIITTGGGGAVVSNDRSLRDRLKHITTTAKQPHRYEYFHDELGFNYRMPNLNACLGLPQLQKLNHFIEEKRKLFYKYRDFFKPWDVRVWTETEGNRSNYWLNAVSFSSREARDNFLIHTNNVGIMTRPIWQLLPTLPMYIQCQNFDKGIASSLYETTVNIPSSVPVYV